MIDNNPFSSRNFEDISRCRQVAEQFRSSDYVAVACHCYNEVDRDNIKNIMDTLYQDVPCIYYWYDFKKQGATSVG